MEIWNASTLGSFTNAIREGFEGDSEFTLIQIHGSPTARAEDLALLRRARALATAKVFLLHRPDEIVLASELRAHFEDDPSARLIFLGDLIYRIPFWEERRSMSVVIPHPHLDFTLPPEARTRPVVGAFTSWGEMRNVAHYLSLVEKLRECGDFEYRIGGSGLEGVELPGDIEVVAAPFVPHFNVQLYHLHGRKRYGESSGSLHRGISIPVIFEANGAERLEGLRVVKVDADDALEVVDYAKAARDIATIAAQSFAEDLSQNLAAARSNTVRDFARAMINARVLGSKYEAEE